MTFEEAEKILNSVDKIAYPKLQNVLKNPVYAQKLYNDFSGNFSELSTILQYTYEHINNDLGNTISNIILSISIVEMKHLNMIGKLIQMLGLPPYYIDGTLKPWNIDCIKYDTGSIKETLQYNIYLEREAIKGYKRAIMGTRNASIQRLFNRIILDERTHIDIFTRLINENTK